LQPDFSARGVRSGALVRRIAYKDAVMQCSRLVGIFALVVVASGAAVAQAQYSNHITGGGGHGGFNGGYGGAASMNPGLGRPNNLSLVIGQTQQAHEEVGDLLSQLRRMQDQQVVNQVNFHTLNDSFYERNGVNFGFNIRGGDTRGGSGVVGLTPTGQLTNNGDIQFRQGGANSAIPPFGGYDPGADNTVGFANTGKDGDMLFNFFGSQGSNRSMVTQSPVITIMNGGQGTISDTSQTPFVTGTIPVVGGMSVPAYIGYNPLPAEPLRSAVQDRVERMRYGELKQLTQGTREAQPDAAPTTIGGGGFSGGPSSADRGDLSVAEIRRQQASESTSEDAELASWLERARGAEAAGKKSVAKIYYRMAAQRATGTQKVEINQKLRELEQ
jgi:hypothetical protein